ncbi:hypothetical protein EYF80_067568 [Liparis tanakae]|uniref:Uncharacterized protein n=1 Tax=Liparis tanakae TaxID=230148 RepID=A0A4Z2E0S8_9TELE|nr:hypothetical protein EYF80_067568 [Liparis tanakae]
MTTSLFVSFLGVGGRGRSEEEAESPLLASVRLDLQLMRDDGPPQLLQGPLHGPGDPQYLGPTEPAGPRRGLLEVTGTDLCSDGRT